jgi:hypothetical protein
MSTHNPRPDTRTAPPVRRKDWRDAVWASDLAPMQRLAALCFADHAPDHGAGVWVTTARAQERTGMARRTWFDQVAGLRAAGWLEQAKPGRSGRDGGRSPEYRLTIPAPMSAGAAPIDDGMSAGAAPIAGMSAGDDGMSAGDSTPTPTGTPTEKHSPSIDADADEWCDWIEATDRHGYDRAWSIAYAALERHELAAYQATNAPDWWTHHERFCTRLLAAYDRPHLEAAA